MFINSIVCTSSCYKNEVLEKMRLRRSSSRNRSNYPVQQLNSKNCYLWGMIIDYLVMHPLEMRFLTFLTMFHSSRKFEKNYELFFGLLRTILCVYFFQLSRLKNICSNEALKVSKWHLTKKNSRDCDEKIDDDCPLLRLLSIKVSANLIKRVSRN